MSLVIYLRLQRIIFKDNLENKKEIIWKSIKEWNESKN